MRKYLLQSSLLAQSTIGTECQQFALGAKGQTHMLSSEHSVFGMQQKSYQLEMDGRSIEPIMLLFINKFNKQDKSEGFSTEVSAMC